MLAFVAGCTEFDEPTKQFQDTEETTAKATPQTRAGAVTFEKLDNPYDLALMRQLKGNPSLPPTHLYVRFLPTDSTQLNTLEDGLALDLFDYLLDVNIEDDEVYVDYTIPEGNRC